MRAGAAMLLAAALAASVAAPLAAADALKLKYRSFDSRGPTGADSVLVLRSAGGTLVGSYSATGSGERRVALNFEEGRIEALYSGLDSGNAFSALFSTAEGSVRVRSGPASAAGWKPSLRDGDTSLFFILPRLLDLGAGASRRALTVIREDDGQRITFAFECRGTERITVGGESFEAYDVEATPADLLIKIFWPYVNRYYFRVGDLVMLRFEGPDDNRRMTRLDLESVEPAD
jgi:hypothetical protein